MTQGLTMKCTVPCRAISLLFALVLGCSNSPTTPVAKAGGEEDAVRQTFVAFQQALKARDADKIWALLDAESQADAEREAEATRTAYGKADAAGKASKEKELGLESMELAALKGLGYLKSKRFHGKYEEVPDSKIESVSMQGDKATINYIEPDNDKMKFAAVREGGKWKLTVPMPKATGP
jgi:hypothetical protein